MLISRETWQKVSQSNDTHPTADQIQLAMTRENTSYNRGYLLALLSAAVLSTTAIFIRYIFNTYHMPPLVLACWRDALVVFTLFLLIAFFRPSLLLVDRDQIRYLVFYGLVLALFNSLWTISVNLNGAAIATVLAYSSAAFTAFLDRWLFKESLGWVKVIAVMLSLYGCVLVSDALDPKAWVANPVGIITGTISGLTYAVYTLMGRSAHQRGIKTWSTLFYTFSFATVFLLAFNLLPGGLIPGAASHPADLLWLGNAWDGWAILFFLAAGPTLTGFWLYNTSLNFLPSSIVNLIVTLEPAFTATSAFYLLGEQLTSIQVFGSLIILLGVIFLRLYRQ